MTELALFGGSFCGDDINVDDGLVVFGVLEPELVVELVGVVVFESRITEPGRFVSVDASKLIELGRFEKPGEELTVFK
jgi:hypothetical protein